MKKVKTANIDKKIRGLQQKIAELKKEIRVLRRDKKRLEQEMTAEQVGKDNGRGIGRSGKDNSDKK